MTELDKSVLIAFAENGMNKSRTGKALFMHRNTVDYHLERVRQKTGKNPNDFFDLAAMLGMVEVVRCKDCKYCEIHYPAKEYGGEAIKGYYCNVFRGFKESDYFCGYGKRKGDT